MPIATGVAKQVAWKKETSFGVLVDKTGSKSVRRVTSDLALKKATYESSEIRTDFQRADFRHGVRNTAGTINGELSPGSWQEPLAAILHRLFATVTPMTAVGITVGAAVSGVYPVTRSAGDFLAANGLKLGQVFRMSVGALNALNLNKNLFVVGLTATIASVIVLNGTALFPEGPIAGCTLTVIGKTTYVPDTGHTDESFNIEHWHSDIAQSELFVGSKFTNVAIDLPPTGMATIKCTVMGKDMLTATSQVLTSPTAANTAGVLAAVNGALVVNGVPQALVTGLSLVIDGEYSAEPVVGSNTYPEIFRGRVLVSGQATVLFQDAVIRDAFLNETESDLVCAFSCNNSATSDFMTFSLNRVKFGASDKSDGPKGLVMTMPFEALYQSTGGVGSKYDKSTMSIQDSLAA